jgi:hypothetical protein
LDLAKWQSGHAAACKAVYAGSIPTLASILRHSGRRAHHCVDERHREHHLTASTACIFVVYLPFRYSTLCRT